MKCPNLPYLMVCEQPALKYFVVSLSTGPKALRIFTGLSSADGYDTILSPRHVNGDPAESNLFIVRLGPRLFGTQLGI